MTHEVKTPKQKRELCAAYLRSQGYFVGPPLIGVADICAYLGISSGTLSKWMCLNSPKYKPDFPRPAPGGKGAMRFSADDFQEWFENTTGSVKCGKPKETHDQHL